MNWPNEFGLKFLILSLYLHVNLKVGGLYPRKERKILRNMQIVQINRSKHINTCGVSSDFLISETHMP